jgi:hypothetical protein
MIANMKPLSPAAWISFSDKSWKQIGSPNQLNPKLIEESPIAYDKACYGWLEEKYSSFLRTLYMELSSESVFIKHYSQDFKRLWETYFDPVTLWKQLIPLLVFANTIDHLREDHLEIAKIYSLGQGIPSVVIDSHLDNSLNTNSAWPDVTLFALTAVVFSIKELLRTGFDENIITIYLSHIQHMYNSMWNEWNTRYNMPDIITENTLEEYIFGESRLTSSVFFGITIEWAFSISGIKLPTNLRKGIEFLRRVRQLNDEIADFEHDVKIGLITYPLLTGLSSKGIGSDLAAKIRSIWEYEQKSHESHGIDDLLYNVWLLLVESGSFEKSAMASMQLLDQSIYAIMDYFSPKNSFDITLLINLRIARLARLRQNKWREIPKDKIYQPVSELMMNKHQYGYPNDKLSMKLRCDNDS